MRDLVSVGERAGAAGEILIAALLLTGCGSQEPIERSPRADVRRLNVDGVRLLAAGDIEAAEERYLEAIRLSQAVDDLEGRAESTYNLADLHAAMGRAEEALVELDMSRELFREIGRADGAARSLARQAAIHLDSGDLDAAGRRLEEALALGSEEAAPEILTVVSALRLHEGKAKEAREAASQALSLARDERIRADALFAMARVEAAAGNRAAARKALLETLDLDHASDSRRHTAETLRFLAELARDEGSRTEAARYFERAAGVYAGLGMSEEAASMERQAATGAGAP